jgi:hypothetical protein
VKKTLLVVILCGLVAAFTPSLYADVFGQYFTGAAVGSTLGNGPFTLGWSFTVTNPNGINVTDLAVFDQGGALLLESHQVGIWDAAGNLLDQAVVDNTGTVQVDQGGAQTWRDVSAPVHLGPGTYTIGATWNSLLDPMIFPGTLAGEGLANLNGPGVVLVQNAFIAGGFADPTNTTGDTMSYFGPNFEYTANTVPEPGTLVMFGSGIIGLAGVLRRKLNM